MWSTVAPSRTYVGNTFSSHSDLWGNIENSCVKQHARILDTVRKVKSHTYGRDFEKCVSTPCRRTGNDEANSLAKAGAAIGDILTHTLQEGEDAETN